MLDRRIGVEEELMLVDPATGAVQPVSKRTLAVHRERVGGAADDESEFGADSGLEQELFLHQLETGTTPCRTAEELKLDLVSCRRAAQQSAEAAGAALVAVGTPVLPGGEQRVTPEPRYERIVEEFGRVGRQGSVCGMHVHVDVVDEAEAVRVVDGLRQWLPVLRAMSVNSPFWRGEDTGYASWRSQVWSRWPTAGPSDLFHDPAGYHRTTRALVESGAALDRGMLYFDARLSENYGTVEIRVCDSMTEPDDVVLLALLTRALVTTVAEGAAERGRGEAAPWRTELLRAAHWRASRYGLSANLLDPRTGRPEGARAVVETLIDFVTAALEHRDEVGVVAEGFQQLVARGTGAARQRAIAESSGRLDAVVTHLRERFAASLA